MDPATTEQQPTGQAPAATPAAPAVPAVQAPAPQNLLPASPPPPAPEEMRLELPAGTDVDPAVLKEFTSMAKESKLSKEQAQAQVNFYLKLNQKAIDSNRASMAQWAKKNEELLRADPEFKDFEAAKAIAQKPLAKFGSPELAKALSDTGWQNHPELAKFLHKIGKAMSEDSTPRPAPASQEISDAQTQLRQRYPSMFRDAE